MRCRAHAVAAAVVAVPAVVNFQGASQHSKSMRKILASIILLVACCPLFGQVLIVSNPADYDHIKDSITESYYPGMFDGSYFSYEPVVPTEHFGTLSEMQTFFTPYDSIKYVVRVNFYHIGEGKKFRKAPGNIVGKAELQLRDCTYPAVCKKTHYTDIGIKRLKKRYKLKFVTYVRCDTPAYPKRETKKITTYVSFSPFDCGNITTKQWVDHLPFSTKAKYGGPYTQEDRERFRAKENKRTERNRAFYERRAIMQREYFKKHPRESKITKKKWELYLNAQFTPEQLKKMEKESKQRNKQNKREKLRRIGQIAG